MGLVPRVHTFSIQVSRSLAFFHLILAGQDLSSQLFDLHLKGCSLNIYQILVFLFHIVVRR